MKKTKEDEADGVFYSKFRISSVQSASPEKAEYRFRVSSPARVTLAAPDCPGFCFHAEAAGDPGAAQMLAETSRHDRAA